MREKLKLYYRCRFTQLSPLRLSGGKNDRTDNDLMLDSRGLPMIPGSALAGVLRGRLTREEAMAIRWHMGFSGEENKNSIGLALEMYPLALATHIADMESTFCIEGGKA